MDASSEKLLKVDYEVMKVENAELRKRLLKALRALSTARSGQAPSKKQRVEEKEKEKKKEKEKPKEKAKEAKAKDKDPPREKPKETERERPDKPQQPQVQEESEPGEPGMNAVMLANAQMEAYNEPIAADLPKEQRSKMLEEKLKRFMDYFQENVQIMDLKSGGVIVKGKMFAKRFGCVFRESGEELQGQSTKRFYFDSISPTYCLDFEFHEHLVTAQPGTPPDGRLGVREPRSERLVVLYEEKDGKISRMWLRPDAENVGGNPTAEEKDIMATEIYKDFEAKLKELKGTEDLGERIFHNYHDIPSVG
ncbi:unnamed protein product [Cladocopium goreaui]|uniref:Uncharacterized protein n=1 Tax=Cladocopium goreaui TaxID=2562237 RepID=A0A9P1C877_9DINO|nr:unnamed protein product [Cladocopium goreaui]